MLKFAVICVVVTVVIVVLAVRIIFMKQVDTNCDIKIVQTEYGQVRGRKYFTIFDEKPYYGFKGIRYARPPIGNLRFKNKNIFPSKAPERLDPWTGVKDAFFYDNDCMQEVQYGSGVTGSEDCLFVNVFVPDTRNAKPLSTMIMIYGGSLTTGTAAWYGPDFLIDNNVILVTFNYRLGPLGFASLATAEYSGNMGFKDQQLAIKWVYDNIKNFDGDPESTTLFGQSSGAMSTQYHSFSQKSKNFFNRAIIQSGSALSAYALHRKNDQIKELTEFANAHGGNISDFDSLRDFLLKVDATTLIGNTRQPIYSSAATTKTLDFIWAPVIEDKNAIDPFLIDHPMNLVQRRNNKNLDIMFGCTSKEMYIFLHDEIVDPSLMEPFGRKLEFQLPLKHLQYDYDSTEYRQIAEKIRNFYFNGETKLGSKNLENFAELMSDSWFVHGVDVSAKYHHQTSAGKTFYYKFEADTSLNMIKKISGVTDAHLPGVVHADDLFYLFRVSGAFFGQPDNDIYSRLSPDSLEVKLIKSTTKLWTNFAKYGTPTLATDPVVFKPIENNVVNYVSITNAGLVTGVDPFKEGMQFWDNLYKEYSQYFRIEARIISTE